MGNYVWVTVDLKDVDDNDLIDELEGRYLNERQLDSLADILKAHGRNVPSAIKQEYMPAATENLQLHPKLF